MSPFRLGVAEKVEGIWKILSGNDIGALLGWWCLQTLKGKILDLLCRADIFVYQVEYLCSAGLVVSANTPKVEYWSSAWLVVSANTQKVEYWSSAWLVVSANTRKVEYWSSARLLVVFADT